MISNRYGAYTVGASAGLKRSDVEKLVGTFRESTDKPDTPLDGRAETASLQLEEAGDVVVKKYHRGGIVRLLLKNRYLNIGRLRAQREYEMLQLAQRKGISVPAPVAWAVQGGLFYRCWLVTQKIPSAVTLARMSRCHPQKAVVFTRRASELVGMLIRHRILHVDLHPGNVVVGSDERVYLIDFDRACRYRFSAARLARRYQNRWQRAVVKHGLPEFLTAELEVGLAHHSRTGSASDFDP